MKYIAFSLLVLFVTPLFAQQEEIEELNNIFSGRYEFGLKKKGLSIDFVKDGEVFRQEYMEISEIDWKGLSFVDDKSAVRISCQSVYPNCIDRKIIRTKSRQSYSRSDMKVSGSEEGQKTIELLGKLFIEE